MTAYKKIEYWLYLCCFMVFAMAVIGAITRLTESGLSITQWQPISGTLPPLNEADWQKAFALYQQTPEFIKKHHWMDMEDFKKIFFWEWLHRLWGRAIGIVYALPLVYFWVRKQIPAGYVLKLFGLLILGGSQGLLGWWMVKSGLIDRPSVSHFRLAAHLALALVIYGLMFWVALDLRRKDKPASSYKTGDKVLSLVALLCLAVTIIWGAFVAGLHAGLVYNSFPLMNGNFTPDAAFSFAHSVQEPGWVQFMHRWLAIGTGMLLLALSWRARYWPLAVMVFVQIGLGIATLLMQVPIHLAATHQAGAIILLSLTVIVAFKMIKR